MVLVLYRYDVDGTGVEQAQMQQLAVGLVHFASRMNSSLA